MSFRLNSESRFSVFVNDKVPYQNNLGIDIHWIHKIGVQQFTDWAEFMDTRREHINFGISGFGDVMCSHVSNVNISDAIHSEMPRLS